MVTLNGGCYDGYVLDANGWLSKDVRNQEAGMFYNSIDSVGIKIFKREQEFVLLYHTLRNFSIV